MAKPLQQLKNAATEIGKLGAEFGDAAATILEQTTLFEKSVLAEAQVISKASRMAKPANPAILKKECAELVDASADAAELKYDIDIRNALHNHAIALSDASAALGWIVAPAALKHARDYKSIVNTLAEDILSRYIDLGCNPIHSDFAESLNAVMDALLKYVEKEHPAGLRWNYAAGATPAGYRRAQRNLRKDSHPIGDFYRLMHSGLTEFSVISGELGGVLKAVFPRLIGAYEEMAKVIETASNRRRPHKDTDAALRMLLMSVQHELTPLVALLDKVPKEDKYAQHCVTLREFLNAMQWCTATTQKMSPVGYIIDVESVTVLYIDRIEKHFGSQDTYVSRLHRAWAASLRKMLNELKDYVKLHHPNELTFDTQKSRKSVDAIMRDVSLTHQLAELKNKSTAKKWTRATITRAARGGKKVQVPAWVKKP
ncbi:unnamed protein product [Chondrus crispus]|uniref:CAP N-terminal domain-containing protein n=1 Tax=Chondrus crispus TaxID=2769 RepID=R7QNW4_CHOCR|nr:unnamed protein product [Chondrus crispus]CDF39789.1 unnamed protein product [Chondrus crispus]|eukprot:XP_005710083.1 unnamed protein product [Chondrus crispus]